MTRGIRVRPAGPQITFFIIMAQQYFYPGRRNQFSYLWPKPSDLIFDFFMNLGHANILLLAWPKSFFFVSILPSLFGPYISKSINMAQLLIFLSKSSFSIGPQRSKISRMAQRSKKPGHRLRNAILRPGHK